MPLLFTVTSSNLTQGSISLRFGLGPVIPNLNVTSLDSLDH